MAQGRDHNKATLVLCVPAGFVALLVTGGSLDVALAAVGGCATALFINPDLDQVGHTTGKSLLLRLPFFGRVWWWLWKPYARWVVPRHQSAWSHLPVLGTLGRLAYLLFPFTPFIAAFSLSKSWGWWPYVLAAVWGLMLADLFHWIMDDSPVDWRRRKSLRRRAKRRQAKAEEMSCQPAAQPLKIASPLHVARFPK